MKRNWSVKPDSSGLPEGPSKAPWESQIRRRLGPGEVEKGSQDALLTADPPSPQYPPGYSIPLAPRRGLCSAAAPSMGSPHPPCSGGWKVLL